MTRWLIYFLRLLLWTLTWPLRRLRRPPDYLVLELRPQMPELPPQRGLIARLLRPQKYPSVQSVVDDLQRLSKLPKVRGLVVLLRPGSFTPSRAETLHHALKAFRDSGKDVHLWTKSLDLQRLVIASAATHVSIARGGSIGPLGMHRTLRFFGDAFRKVGVRLDVIGSGPHKSAYDAFTRNGPSPEANAMMDWLFDDLYLNAIELIAAGRNVSVDTVRSWVDEGLLTDDRALEAALVDAVANESGVFRQLAPSRLVRWSRVPGLLRQAPMRPGRPVVGVLYVRGAIVDGPSKSSPLGIPIGGMSQRVGDETVIAQCRQLARNKRVKAVVAYIDSPGGSAAASEAMADALESLAARKPLIAVMGSVAASGGYYVATPARQIFARHSTLTGSIGVIMAKVVNDGLLSKLSIASHDIKRGERADIFSPQAPFSDADRELLRQHMARTYALFTGRVAQARGIQAEALEALAQGRVWTGRQAKGHGLVDAIGGLDDGLKAARQLANLPADAPVVVATTKAYTPPLKSTEGSNTGDTHHQLLQKLASFVEASEWLDEHRVLTLSTVDLGSK